MFQIYVRNCMLSEIAPLHGTVIEFIFYRSLSINAHCIIVAHRRNNLHLAFFNRTIGLKKYLIYKIQ